MTVLNFKRRRTAPRGGYGYRLGGDRMGVAALAGWFVAATVAGGLIALASTARDAQGRAAIGTKLDRLMSVTRADAKAPRGRPAIRDYIFDVPARTGPHAIDTSARQDGRWSDVSVARSTAVYYSNCAQAWAAGAAPIRVGEPGYRTRLDGDLDGIACEPFRRRR